MKHAWIIYLAILAIYAAWFALEANAAEEPNKSPSLRWEADIQRFEAADLKNPPQKNAVLFIGSSGIVLWNTLAQDFPECTIINRGFGGSQIADSTYYADRIVIPYKPRLIVLRAGTNDIAAGLTPEQVSNDFQAFVAKVRASLPQTRIVMMSLSPSPARWGNFTKETKANELIRAYIRSEKNLDYFDVVADMLRPDGKPRPELYAPDRLHNSAEGYKLWASLVRPYLCPREFTPGSWSLVLLPDTQNYSEKYPGLFSLQTRWIAKNKDKYNIRYVVGLGDITNNNTDVEWRHAREAVDELDGAVPYALAAGNHDYTPHGDPSAKTGLNTYFPASKFPKWPTFGGVMEEGDSANCYHLFSAGGADWLILVLEWAPRDATVRWANEVLAKYPQRKAILVTHAYMYHDDTRYDFAKKGKSQDYTPHGYQKENKSGVNDGEELWQKLVRKNNIVLTVSGHVLGDGLGFRSDKNDRGDAVHQMLVNYQMRALGGEGYLRILEFQPDGRTVLVKSYSPLFDKYLDDGANQFRFAMEQ